MQNEQTLMQIEPGAPVAGAGFSSDTQDQRIVPRVLSGREKAAIVVRLLLNEGADIPLEELPEDLQEKLTLQMGRMGLVDRVTLATVAQEFTEALDGVGLSFPHGLAGALDAVAGRIGPSTAARLRKEAGVRQSGDPWQRLRALDAGELAAVAQAESTEVAAVMLSKLDTAKAAELLGHLPGPEARRITLAMSRTAHVTPETVDRIGWALAAQLDRKPDLAFKDAPGERVGAILNHSPAATRDGLLSALDEEDTDFASEVRRAIFTFEHIPRRIQPRDVPAILRGVDQATLTTALAGASTEGDQAAVDFLLSNTSSRMADTLREEMGERGKVKQAEAEQAMAEIVGTIRTLESEGGITLIPLDEDSQVSTNE
ncbi:flagellar motor switch protein FliG [Ruegeria marisrubri]|uniref:Flagellar motor switch protein FliG n=1 Tax=Ruegeria marisrubri TaxID=1685379 RepID=A0A0X3U074_9RHOB|nr:FliG C-terminal domain-containing protein [Ruegeria marisrubri]KUJ80711.1 flagellar motor switch protein FliG [Ruegeria marisrubri]